ncbi:MTRF1L release factor glutamine methyltransferase [Macrosteles quadrilineatus]|uniref:MTRF1L release factor glutamine methyltransferase n=1 Tax=Macrosteles quadrilineatus TaxID=74068 RepID=UPI0023E29C3C|nr:MTRF1L release factor glutamine methyltransferase [Macrosteles quadrilineatus]
MKINSETASDRDSDRCFHGFHLHLSVDWSKLEAHEYDLNFKREVTEEEECKIKQLCECRLARMPVQYIIKEWDFRDLRLTMTPPVFIPRPETEQLVELVLEKATPDSTILEIGCGSGAICLSLLKALPQTRVTAVDQSKLACELTKKNAEQNNLADNLKVVQSKLQDDGTLSQPVDLDDPVDIIVSNPPYVPYAQLMDLEPEIKLYEDLRALEAGKDGLRVVKSLLTLASTTLRPGGLLFLEVDASHPTLIEQWITKHPQLNMQFVKSYKDFCEKDRFVELKKV